MEQEHLNSLYKEAFQNIDKGQTYEDISKRTGIPIRLLKLNHIKQFRQSEDYKEQIQVYTLNLIEQYGPQILFIENINKLIQTIPYKFRSAVKHLIYNLKKEIIKRKLDVLP